MKKLLFQHVDASAMHTLSRQEQKKVLGGQLAIPHCEWDEDGMPQYACVCKNVFYGCFSAQCGCPDLPPFEL